ncbi:hypothetical protein [Bradyrhizobium sp. CCBAU 53340]|uniref:hypothetical protein n=1 Tax=Bradyrhizobium sp. CCBAU 53340 TaxID=1325112 RepID=UPI00188C5857|nr:hypothetical protein [Bradyrhizobium sp. CCBAU 53340]
MAKVSLRIISFPHWLSTLVDGLFAHDEAQFQRPYEQNELCFSSATEHGPVQTPPNVVRLPSSSATFRDKE